MTFWDFAHSRTGPALIMCLVAFFLVRFLLLRLGDAWRDWLEARNVRLHGWPPAQSAQPGEIANAVIFELEKRRAKMRERQ